MELGDVVVSATGIEKYFGENHVLRGVSMDVRQHETVMLIGRSGSGKTTMLRCLNFLEEPTVGSVRIGDITVDAVMLEHPQPCPPGADTEAAAAGGHGVPGGFELFPHMTVLQNCTEAPIKVKGVPRDQAVTTAERYLDKVQMLHKRDEYPSRLSGGQKQRVAIARALSMDPQVLMFDEPTSALDPELVGEVLLVMKTLAHEGSTMIVVSHEMQFCREAADRVLFMEGGVVVEEGPPEQVLNEPQQEATRQFLRRFLDT